ncbi:MAG: redoxin domain-containing protein [Clostridiales bacterium]|nr:redoxin domain-containing protein [Clostridiales bacterium]
MSKFFHSIKDWFKRHKPSKRRLIQLYVALLYNANIKGFVTGNISQSVTKSVCVPGLNCYSCPGAVGACPLGSLQNAFAQSETRAPYYILGIIGLFGLIFARTICGFLCPVGLGQELLHLIPSFKIKKSRLTRVLSYLKYVILVALVVAVPLLYGMQGIAVPAFCKFICPAGTLGGGVGLLINPANWNGSRDLLNMLGSIFTWKFALMCAILVLCVFMYRPFCRFLCPLGAIYGFFNKIAFLGVKVDQIKCTDCGLCVSHCQMDVKRVGDHECINCGKCMKVCPVKAISWKGSEIFGKRDKAQPSDLLTDEITDTVTSTPTSHNVNTSFNSTAAITDSQSSNNERGDSSTPGVQQVTTKQKRNKAFWTQIVAWSLAILLLVGALLYFNVFAEQQQVTDIMIGTPCSDFTLNIYGENDSGNYRLLEDKFTLSEQKGSVVVINFWATWCGPCVAELPYFNQAATEYPEVKFIAIHGSSTEDVARFIIRPTDTKESWRNYNVIFLQDEIEGKVCKTFQALGGISSWPMTLIVDKNGNITFTKQGSITYDKLVSEVEKALTVE